MNIVEVKNDQQASEFLQLPTKLYKESPHWIRPLDEDINNVFDPKTNKKFRDGELNRWVLKNNDKKVIGRIAAFYDKKTMNRNNDQPTGGLGFFECIDDKDAAFLLFDTAKQWLVDKGMEAMDGPINFGERDRWWGCLIDGFDIDPNYCCNYHLPYYQKLFEAYGFQVYFQQFTYGRKVLIPLREQYEIKAKDVLQDPDYKVTHMIDKDIDKWAGYFVEIYNKAWSGHKGVPQLQLSVAKVMFRKMKPIMDRKILYFAFYKDEPVGFYIMLPEVNQIFKYVNGKMDWIGKMKFVYHQLMKTNRKVLGLVFGVVPEHQKKGVDAAMIVYAGDMIMHKYKRYEDLEMNWIGDFNPRMINMIKYLDPIVVKTHNTYRKLFDETKPFKRHPILK